MDVERCAISKALKDSDISAMVDAKITTEFFEDEEHRLVWAYILEYKSDYGSVPTPKVIREECDGWKPVDVVEPIEYYIDRLKLQRKRSILGEAIKASATTVNEDPDEAMGFLQHALTMVGTEITSMRDENLITSWEERLSRYEELEQLEGGLRGIPTGFRTIDIATSGLQGGQLISLIGPPKAGKSTVALSIARAANKYGKRVLFIGFEMSNEEQETRHDAMEAGISFTRLNTGKLTPQEKQKLQEALKKNKSMPDFILSADQSATTTLAGVDAKIEQYLPDVVIIDGVYMMETPEIQADTGSPQSLTYLTRNFKRMCQRRDIPIVITTQVIESRFNRKKGLKATDIGYSSSFAQDSDVVIGVEPTDNEQINRLRIVIARSAPKIYTDINWDWDTGSFNEMWGGDSDDEDGQVDTAAFD